jgi:hypothetical protein
MNTLSTYLPYKTAKADMLVAPFAALYKQRAKMRVWAFSAAVRLSDQDKPIALKLLVEVAIVVRTLALLAHNARCATGKTVVATRAARPNARVAVRRTKPASRSVAVNTRANGGERRQAPKVASRVAVVAAVPYQRSSAPLRAQSRQAKPHLARYGRLQ